MRARRRTVEQIVWTLPALRELQDLLAQGLTPSQAARQLGITRHQVRHAIERFDLKVERTYTRALPKKSKRRTSIYDGPIAFHFSPKIIPRKGIWRA